MIATNIILEIPSTEIMMIIKLFGNPVSGGERVDPSDGVVDCEGVVSTAVISISEETIICIPD